MLVQRADVDGVEPLVRVFEDRNDKGIKRRRANIDCNVLGMLLFLPIDASDFVCSS